MKKIIYFIIIIFAYNVSFAISDECFTQEQLNSEINKERRKWDVNDDNIYGIEEVIYALELLSGIGSIEGLQIKWTGNNRIRYFVYAGDTKVIDQYISKDETQIHDLVSGEYKINLFSTYGSLKDRTFNAIITTNNGKLIIPPVGNLVFTWNGKNHISYYIYAEDNMIVSDSINKDETQVKDLAPADYKIVLHNKFGSLEDRTSLFKITKDRKTPFIPSVGNLEFKWIGERIRYFVYAGDTEIIDQYINKDETHIHDLAPGEYRLALNTTYGSLEDRSFPFTITKDTNTLVIPPVGNFEFTWNGNNNISYYIYAGDNLIVSDSINKDETQVKDLAPADYKIVLHNKFGSLEDRTSLFKITKDTKTPFIPSVGNLEFTWIGERIRYFVYAEDTEIIDQYINKDETHIHDLAPGEYRIVVDNDETNFTIHQNQIYYFSKSID